MEIDLDDNRTQYETGQFVSGTARIGTDGHLNAVDVYLALVGTTELEWIPKKVYGVYATGGSMAISAPLTFQEMQKCLELVHNVSDQGNVFECIQNKQVYLIICILLDIKKLTGTKEIPFKFKLPERCVYSIYFKLTRYLFLVAFHRHSWARKERLFTKLWL